jgi:hypothetical protein
MLERFLRIELIGIPTSDIADWLGLTEYNLARWINGSLPSHEADIVEVGLSLLEMRVGLSERRKASVAPTMRLAGFAAA